jgi:ribosomal protein S18 acetylase RimI-like enzyme
MPTIRRARSEEDLKAVRRLFRAYVESLEFDLDFQNVEQELADLPGPYAPPEGTILLADVENKPVGVVALQPLDENGVCEMKRLYVQPDHRGRGIGQALGQEILDAARTLGYEVMRLDTVASMTAARHLYRSLGFEERSAYYANPLDDVVYIEEIPKTATGKFSKKDLREEYAEESLVEGQAPEDAAPD